MKSKSISRVLVANRGEIAVRVMQACREMGIKTVAVYSEADQRAAHVQAAHQALPIGPAPALESYLRIDKLLDAARQSGCDAVHPGYGFLSENADFARQCIQAGFIFIGPSPEAMEQVGDKLTARATMEQAGIPMTAAVELDLADPDKIAADAARIGYPVMIKASAGGGGKGMRVVRQASELNGAIEAGQREARSAFGNETVFMEKFVERPRHIEVQVVADHYGKTVHLFERECSIQRRHQKIVEESPSVVLDDALRDEIGKTACRVMEAVNYTNAGTVEFLLDVEKKFYFLEVNARIQVEHPVTEMVTGVDLVKTQIQIAAGEKLPFAQEDLQQRGHAIECRIYAEDAANNFFPSVGKLHLVREPAGPGIRCDSGIFTGLEVTHHYDPILSKLIVYGSNRQEAINKMVAALQDYVILGVKTSLTFLEDLIRHPAFEAGELHTGFLDEHFKDWEDTVPAAQLQLAMLAAVMKSSPFSSKTDQQQPLSQSPWQTVGQWEMFSDK